MIPFSCLQSFPASGSFSVSRFFASCGQSVGTSASSVLPMNIQGWFPLGLIGLILQSKGLSRVFPNTTILKIHFDVWQNWYNYVKFENRIKFKKKRKTKKTKASSCLKQHKFILLWSWRSEVQNETFLAKIRESARMVPSWGSWRGLFLDCSNF